MEFGNLTLCKSLNGLLNTNETGGVVKNGHSNLVIDTDKVAYSYLETRYVVKVQRGVEFGSLRFLPVVRNGVPQSLFIIY